MIGGYCLSEDKIKELYYLDTPASFCNKSYHEKKRFLFVSQLLFCISYTCSVDITYHYR